MSSSQLGTITYEQVIQLIQQQSINPTQIQGLEQIVQDQIQLTKLSDLLTPDQNVSLDNYRITNLQDPISNQDAANKQYVDQQDQLLQTQINNNLQSIQTLQTDLQTETNTRIIEDQLLQTQITQNSSDIVNLQNSDVLLQNQITSNDQDILALQQFDQNLNINGLQIQTNDYDTNGFQITNINPPLTNNDLTNKLYVDQQSQNQTLQTAYDQSSTPAQIVLSAGKPINILDQSLNPIMSWDNVNNEILYGVNLRGLGSANVQTSQIGIDLFKINLDGDVVGNQLIEATQTLNINTSGNNLQTIKMNHNNNEIASFQFDKVVVQKPIDMSNQSINNLLDPVLQQDASTKNYVDVSISNLINSAPDLLNTLGEISLALGQDPNFSTTIMTALSNKSDISHTHLHTDITDFDTGVQQNTLNSLTVPDSFINMNLQQIKQLADPTIAQDAVTKSYVDTQNTAQTLQQLYDQSATGIIQQSVLKPFQINDSLGVNVLQVNETSIVATQPLQVTNDISTIGNRSVFTQNLDLNSGNMLLTGLNMGKSSISTTNGLNINMNAPSPNDLIDFQTNAVSKFQIAKTFNQSQQELRMNNQLIRNVLDPILPQDAATKAYVDSNSGGGGGTQIAQYRTSTDKNTNLVFTNFALQFGNFSTVLGPSNNTINLGQATGIYKIHITIYTVFVPGQVRSIILQQSPDNVTFTNLNVTTTYVFNQTTIGQVFFSQSFYFNNLQQYIRLFSTFSFSGYQMNVTITRITL